MSTKARRGGGRAGGGQRAGVLGVPLSTNARRAGGGRAGGRAGAIAATRSNPRRRAGGRASGRPQQATEPRPAQAAALCERHPSLERGVDRSLPEATPTTHHPRPTAATSTRHRRAGRADREQEREGKFFAQSYRSNHKDCAIPGAGAYRRAGEEQAKSRRRAGEEQIFFAHRSAKSSEEQRRAGRSPHPPLGRLLGASGGSWRPLGASGGFWRLLEASGGL